MKQFFSGISKKTGLIFVTAVLLLGSLGYWVQAGKNSVITTTKNDTLKYIINSNDEISFDPIYSDIYSHNLYMSALVGTLVKRGTSGRYLPYLAQEWSTSDFKTWRFVIRDSIFTENNELITAKGFKKSLETVIKIYHAIRPSLPIIEEIVGFSEYLKGEQSNISGITFENNVLIIVFQKPINSGVLEFLSMPYYGYYNQDNFKDGKWANGLKIVSSSSHKIESVDIKNKSLILNKRSNWFSLDVDAVEKILILQMNLSESFLMPGPKIIATNGVIDNDQIKSLNYSVVVGAPEMLVALQLNISSGFFSSNDNRSFFLKKLRIAQESIKLEGEGLIFSKFFYPFYQTKIEEKNEALSKYIKLTDQINAFIPQSVSAKRPEYLKSLINTAMENSSVNINFIESQPVNKSELNKIDIRLKFVSIGGGFQHWLTKMMFCSDLGISFSDPENGICNLVEKYDGLNWNINEFAKEFNQTLFDQAAIIPIFHNSHKWIVDGVDVELSPISLIPRFDLMKLK